MASRRPPIPRDLRFHIYGRDRFRCRYCAIKVTFRSATLDHIHPWCQGGPHADHNLVTCCWQCNKRKKDQTLQELGWVLLPIGTRVIDLPELGIKVPRERPNRRKNRKSKHYVNTSGRRAA